MRMRLIVIVLVAILVSACSFMPRTATSTEVLPTVVAPTATQLPATSTPQPTLVPTSAPTTATDLSSMGTPIPEWDGVQIMPGANEGRPAGFSYVYSVDVPVDEAETFYVEQMESDGWTLSNRQASETSLYGGPATILDFERDDEAFNIMLIFSTTNNYTMVMLTRVKP